MRRARALLSCPSNRYRWSAAMTRLCLAIGALMLALLIPLAQAQSGLVGVLKGSPFANFTEADYGKFFAAVTKAADGPVAAPGTEWTDPDSGASGIVRSTSAVKRPEGDCRILNGTNTARGRTESFVVTVCRARDGSWKLVPNDTAPKPEKSVAAGALMLPASYTGVLPCADCPGMRYALDLHADGSYRLRTTYLERGPDKKGLNVDESGAWQRVVNGTRVTLLSEKNAMSTFVIVDANTLRMVDAQGKEFTTKLNYDLKRDKTYTPVAAAQ
jgi:uncharacterized lipoprotein NlpE involved in copper resistance/surface antigen